MLEPARGKVTPFVTLPPPARVCRLKLREEIKWWIAVVIWMLVIFMASSDALSAEHTSRYLVPLLRWLKPNISAAAIETIHTFIRKGAHLTEYAILALLLWRAVHHSTRGGRRFWREAAIVISVAVLFAAADEFHQSFVPSRGASPRDVLIDTCGVIVAVIICGRLRRAGPPDKSAAP